MILFMLCVAVLAFLFVPMKESIHMYQQNRYQMERYLVWIKKHIRINYKYYFRLGCLFLPFYGFLFVPSENQTQILLILLLIIYAYLLLKWDSHHEYIQKISFTHRVKRLYIMECIIYVTFMIFLYSCFSNDIIILLVPVLFFSPYALLWISGTIMFPVEQKIRYSYVHEAKKILAKQEKLIKIGITGSYGKTSVKNILHALLSEQYYSFMTPHSYNNLMGLTISIRKLLKSLHEVFIAEIGADHVGEISELANFIQPSIVIICAVGPQHLETFGSQENILHEKMQLVEQMHEEGVAVLNYDNDFIRNYSIHNKCKVITYGIHREDVDVRAVNIMYSIKGSTFLVKQKDAEFQVETCLLGEHNVLNILAGISVARNLNVPINQIISAIKRLRSVPHRLEVCPRGNYVLLDDAYNSNPQGAKYALEVLSQMPGKRFLITPGFLDLGIETTKAHFEFGKVMKQQCDIVILIGPIQTKDIYQSLQDEQFSKDHIFVVNSTKEAFSLVHTLLADGDTVLIENDLPDAFNY